VYSDSDRVAIIIEKVLLVFSKVQPACGRQAHCNIKCYGALHLFLIIHSQSTNIWVRCTCFHEVIPFDIRFKEWKNLENNYFRSYLTFSSVVRQFTDHQGNNF
jgi:hypothetical protein